MRRKVYRDGNGSSLIMVEGLGEYVPKSEFVKIKAELEQHDDQITNIEIANQEMLAVADARINKLVDENNELKAMVDSLSAAAIHVIDSLSCNKKAYTLKQEDLDVLQEAHALTPQQCLASVKADAIKDATFNSEQIDIDGHKYVGLEDLEVNINQLLEK